jgi:putative intracellular protease/amidase
MENNQSVNAQRSKQMEHEQQTVHLFVLDTLADWEPGFAIAGINNPSWQVQPGRYTIKTVGARKAPIKTLGGVTILPDLTLDDLEPEQSAMLILPGGDLWGDGMQAAAIAKAQAFLKADVPVAAICGATVALAEAGILNERPHTSNALEYLKTFESYRGEAHYQHQLAVTAGSLITATGTAPLDFAYQIFKKLEVYRPATLDAWYGLYKTNDPKYFFALRESVA